MKMEITGKKMRQLLHYLWGISSMYLFYDGYDWQRDWEDAYCDLRVKSLQMLAGLVTDEGMEDDLITLVYDIDSFKTNASAFNEATARFYAEKIIKEIERIVAYVEEKNEQE